MKTHPLLSALLLSAITLSAFGQNQSAFNAPVSAVVCDEFRPPLARKCLGSTGVSPVLSGVPPESLGDVLMLKNAR